MRLASFLPRASGEQAHPLALTTRQPNVDPDMNPQEPNPEDVDLAALVDELRAALPLGEGVVGYLRGKSLMRDVLVERKGYSALLAEELIDTLEVNGYLRFEGDPSERSVADAHWAVGPEFEHRIDAGCSSGSRSRFALEDEPAEPRQGVEVADEERGEGLPLDVLPALVVLEAIEVEAPAVAGSRGNARDLGEVGEGDLHLHRPAAIAIESSSRVPSTLTALCIPDCQLRSIPVRRAGK